MRASSGKAAAGITIPCSGPGTPAICPSYDPAQDTSSSVRLTNVDIRDARTVHRSTHSRLMHCPATRRPNNHTQWTAVPDKLLVHSQTARRGWATSDSADKPPTLCRIRPTSKLRLATQQTKVYCGIFERGPSASVAYGSPACSPESVQDPYIHLGTHPELVSRLWDRITSALPVRCNWVVYGAPVLVRPDTGIIFAFAGGTSTYALRLPPKQRAELVDAAMRRAQEGAARLARSITSASATCVLSRGMSWNTRVVKRLTFHLLERNGPSDAGSRTKRRGASRRTSTPDKQVHLISDGHAATMGCVSRFRGHCFGIVTYKVLLGFVWTSTLPNTQCASSSNGAWLLGRRHGPILARRRIYRVRQLLLA